VFIAALKVYLGAALLNSPLSRAQFLQKRNNCCKKWITVVKWIKLLILSRGHQKRNFFETAASELKMPYISV
jgi:hypothetical protein